MNTPFSRGMARATALTRLGKLREATALIQSLLRPQATPDMTPALQGDIIDGDFTTLDPVAPPRTKPARRRTPLGETLRKIAAGGMPAGRAKTGTAPPLPPGAQFLALTHTGIGGTRDYRLFIPANRSPANPSPANPSPANPSTTPLPLIVMLHGCTQTPEDFAAGTAMNQIAQEFGCLVAYPAQPSGANMQKCWNWYRPEDQQRGAGEPALIAGITRDIQRDHGGDPARSYVAGLSAGGAAAVLVAAAYPDIFAAAGVHSGLPAGGAHDIPSAFAAMRNGSPGKSHGKPVPTIVFHGTQDQTVHPDNGTAVLSQAVAALPALRVAAVDGVAPGGRRFRTTTHTDAKGRTQAEMWQIEGAGHAWAGGHPSGSYTDATGPDASRQMMRFFLQHRLT